MSRFATLFDIVGAGTQRLAHAGSEYITVGLDSIRLR
jgi:hypothetical protein